MLALSRNVGESIIINGNIEVFLLEIVHSKKARIGVMAPRSVRVDRSEVDEARRRGQHDGWVYAAAGISQSIEI